MAGILGIWDGATAGGDGDGAPRTKELTACVHPSQRQGIKNAKKCYKYKQSGEPDGQTNIQTAVRGTHSQVQFMWDSLK